jgi:hypothetical protein
MVMIAFNRIRRTKGQKAVKLTKIDAKILFAQPGIPIPSWKQKKKTKKSNG